MEDRDLREQLPRWIAQMRKIASTRPGTGACAVGTAMELWAWTFDRTRKASERDAASREAAAAPLAESLGWLLAARAMVLTQASEADQAAADTSGELPAPQPMFADLCHAHVARTCGEVGRICAELVFGVLRHPAWDADSYRCYRAADLEMLEEYVPGLAASARAFSDVIEADGSHRDKAGPCVRFEGLQEFVQLRTRLDGCLAGGHTARQRATQALL